MQNSAADRISSGMITGPGLLISILLLGAALLVPDASAAICCNDVYTEWYNVTNNNQDWSPIHINDTSGVTINGFLQRPICPNTTTCFCLNTTNESAYDCYQGNTQLNMVVEYGNGSDTATNPYDSDVLYFGHMSNLTRDYSGYNRGVATGGNPFVNGSGKIGDAGEFDGNDYLNLSGSDLPTGNNEFTVGVWYKGSTTGDSLLGLGTATSGKGFMLMTDNNVCTLTGYGPNQGTASGSTNIVDNAWHFCVGIYWGNKVLSVYTDGNWEANNTAGNNADITSAADVCGFNDGSYACVGLMDYAFIINRTLSDDEIIALMNSTNPDNSSYLGDLHQDNCEVSLENPSNTTIAENLTYPLTWHFTRGQTGGTCNTSYYDIDGGERFYTLCANETITEDLSVGSHNITIWANDSNGTSASETIHFTIANPIVNCSETGASVALDFVFYDEISLASLNGSAEYVIDVTEGSFNYTYNLSVVNVTNFTVCIQGDSQVVDMMMLYRSSGYEQRTYYLYQAEITSTLQTINLYQITQATGEKIDVNTRDSNDNDVADVYVDIDRYYPATDSYRTVAICRSDRTGIFNSYVDLDDVFYRFTLSQAGTSVNTYAAMTITDTDDDPETLVLYIGALETQFFEMIGDIGVSCYFNETTNNTVCSLTDPSGLAVTATLTVQRQGLASMTDICSDTGSGASFTLSCNVPDPDGEYKYFVTITPADNPDYVIYTDFFYTPQSNIYGVAGLFIAFLLIIAMAGVGIYIHEILGILLGVTMGIIAVSGIITLPGVTITSMIIMGILILIGSTRR